MVVSTWFRNNICCAWTKPCSYKRGHLFNSFTPGISLTCFVWFYADFGYSFGINHWFTKYLKEDCWLTFDQYFSLYIIRKLAGYKGYTKKVKMFLEEFVKQILKRIPSLELLYTKCWERPFVYVSHVSSCLSPWQSDLMYFLTIDQSVSTMPNCNVVWIPPLVYSRFWIDFIKSSNKQTTRRTSIVTVLSAKRGPSPPPHLQYLVSI